MSGDEMPDTVPAAPERGEVAEYLAELEAGLPAAVAKVPVLSLAKLREAAHGRVRYPSGVRAVQGALVARRFTPQSYVTTGVFDSSTIQAYRALQLHLGFSSGRADGIPDSHSLTWLGLRTGRFQTEG